jgi:acetate kinase
LEELTALTPLAPLHQPHNLSPIRAIAAARPWLPQVACFDTSFHRTMPAVAARFALPRDYETMGVRRYGFHGLSYEYIAKRLDEVAPGIARKKVIVAHLGNGASLCALDGGISIDTTMGFSALDGLVMGTRCGALDPGVVLYLLEELRRSPKAVEDLLYQRSGLLGVSGITGDMRKLLESDDPRASEAIDLFVFHVVRNIAALAASLKGLDAVVFTAGIGENSPEIRRRVVAGLTWMGAELEDAANNAAALLISKPSSAVQLYVLPTNEEAIICRHTRTILAAI